MKKEFKHLNHRPLDPLTPIIFRDILNRAAEYLKSLNIPSARLDSEVLLSFTLNKDRTYLYTNSEKPILPEEHKKFKELIERRGRREPLSYITGEKEFWSLKFKVTRDTLIPRPETEILVQAVVDIIRSKKQEARSKKLEVFNLQSSIFNPIHILDIGTGSGNVAVSIAKESPGSHVFTVDKSDSALSVAKENAIIHNVAGRITFLKGDLYKFKAQSSKLKALKYEALPLNFDIIVSNPPYIPTGDIEGLMSEVRDWEPRWALDGGKDGLEIIRKIIKDAPLFLKPEGFLAMEIGFGQADEVRNIIEETGKFSDIRFVKDLAGINRVVVAELQAMSNE